MNSEARLDKRYLGFKCIDRERALAQGLGRGEKREKLAPSSRKLPASLGIALLNLGLLLTPAAIPSPARGAERIYINYGPLEFSLPVSALELYAKEGKINDELAAYAGYVEPQQLEQLRRILLARVDVTPVAIAQFLYSPQGEIILDRLGQIIQTKAGQEGLYAIRAALIKAAADPEGLTLLNVLQEFPTYGIRINSARTLRLIEELSNLVRRTQTAIAAVEQQATSEAAAQQSEINSTQASQAFPAPFAQEPNYFPPLPDLRQQGPISSTTQSFTLNDIRRGRTFPVDLYLPNLPNGKPAPLVVISHGLGSDRGTFEYLAKHLASYGFAVAVPEHPGSNAAQIQALIEGLADEVTPPRELIDRPLDIKFLLDELQRSYGRQLNLQQVGVLGQSFGGYTVLALTGAEINFEQIEQDCDFSKNNSLNVSLLLQCRARELLQIGYSLSDERVKAAIAINPVGSTIFGQSEFSEIAMPLMLVASSDDTVAPALPEQIRPFTWLTTPDKYLVLLREGTHFSTLEESTGGVPVPESVIGPSPPTAQAYIKALSVAFFGTYIANNPEYRPYLSAAYAQSISQNIIPLSLIESLTPEQLRGVPTEETNQAPPPSQANN